MIDRIKDAVKLDNIILKKHALVRMLERGEDSVIVINKVPALICEQCGDDFIDIQVTRKIEALLKKLESEGLKMGFVDYTRAA